MRFKQLVAPMVASGLIGTSLLLGASAAYAATSAVGGEQTTAMSKTSIRNNLAGDICLGEDSTAVRSGAHGVPPRIIYYKDYETPFRNCGPGPVSARVDIAFHVDTPCRMVQPGQTVVFRYRVEWTKYSPEPGPRSVVRC